MTTIPFVDEIRLVALIQDPATTKQAWADRAACAKQRLPGEPFFPEDGEVPPVEALACCLRCPVALECLATALIHDAVDGYRSGWWGGRGPDDRALLWERLKMRVPRPAADVDLTTPAAIARYLHSQQRSVPAIAAELGCTERTVYRYLAASAA